MTKYINYRTQEVFMVFSQKLTNFGSKKTMVLCTKNFTEYYAVPMEIFLDEFLLCE